MRSATTEENMELNFTGIEVLAGKIALYLLVALILGFVFGWRSAAPSEK